jgi:hypothetical protein
LSDSPKLATPEEYAELVAAGIDFYGVFEIGISDYRGAFLGGVELATRALTGAEQLGYPGKIFMTVDTHMTDPSMLALALDYQEGAARVLGDRHSVYGFSELIDACAARGLGSAYWVAGHQPPAASPAHWWQRNDGRITVNGIQCDVNVELKPIPGDEVIDMTPDQAATLAAVSQQVADIHGQLCTPLDPWLGGMSNVENDGTDDPNREKYFPVQTILRDNVSLTQLSNLLKSLSVGQAGEFGAFSDADIKRFSEAVATALAALLSTKLAS